MTISEALYVIKRLPLDTFYEGKAVKSDRVIDIGSDIFDRKNTDEIKIILEELFNYLLKLDFDPVLFADILNEEGDCDYISDLDGKSFRDDRDYVVFTGNDFYIWTEVLGNIYFLSDYNKTWKYSKHIPTAEEIRIDEETAKRMQEMVSRLVADFVPKITAPDLVEVHPIMQIKK